MTVERLAPDITIGSYRAEDLADVVVFQDSLWFGGTEGNTRYFHWKYRDNPYLDHRYIVVARQRGEIVGMIGVFGSLWEHEGRTYMLPCLTDTIVSLEHRGGPLFLAMTDEVAKRLEADGVPWLLDFGDQYATPAMIMAGWTQIGPWGQAVLMRETALFEEDSPWSRLPAARGARSGEVVRAVSAPDAEAMAGLVRRLPHSSGIKVARNADYFRWRAANPLARYFHLEVGDDELRGFLIGHRAAVDTDDGHTPTTIVDCEATTDDIFADLAAFALEHLPGRELLMWTRDLSPERVGILRDLGTGFQEPALRFTDDLFLPNLVVRETGAGPCAPAPELMRTPDFWHVYGVSGRAWR
ncbi:GNAT family N-acetyltransferase [Streptomyces sp. NPDC060000]|uniref:GNAT family N-acetyltransferase n=1 Tax=Streptomyces sp. NPDC060000 TaxID=3347031 RepID=UPI0036C143DB